MAHRSSVIIHLGTPRRAADPGMQHESGSLMQVSIDLAEGMKCDVRSGSEVQLGWKETTDMRIGDGHSAVCATSASIFCAIVGCKVALPCLIDLTYSLNQGRKYLSISRIGLIGASQSSQFYPLVASLTPDFEFAMNL